jgi:hypothetical protein
MNDDRHDQSAPDTGELPPVVMPDPVPHDPVPKSMDSDSIVTGCFTGIAILVGHALLVLVGLGPYVLIAGLTQWVIVIPLAISWSRQGRSQSVAGLLIIAGLATLPLTTCFGLLVLVGLQ